MGRERLSNNHLGYEKHNPAGHRRGNTRNGKSRKNLRSEFGELELETPRDRKATFEPRRKERSSESRNPL
jgi:putative transposase